MNATRIPGYFHDGLDLDGASSNTIFTSRVNN